MFKPKRAYTRATQIKKTTTEASRHGGKTRRGLVKFEICVPLLINLTNLVVFWRKTGDLISATISPHSPITSHCLKSGFVSSKTGFQAISAPCFRVSVVNLSLFFVAVMFKKRGKTSGFPGTYFCGYAGRLARQKDMCHFWLGNSDFGRQNGWNT